MVIKIYQQYFEYLTYCFQHLVLYFLILTKMTRLKHATYYEGHMSVFWKRNM